MKSETARATFQFSAFIVHVSIGGAKMKRTNAIIAAISAFLLLAFPCHVFAQKMKVGYWTSGFSLGFGAVMEEMKFAEKEGLNVEWVKFAEVNGPTRAIV